MRKRENETCTVSTGEDLRILWDRNQEILVTYLILHQYTLICTFRKAAINMHLFIYLFIYLINYRSGSRKWKLIRRIPDGKLRSLTECEVLGHSVLHVVCPVFLAWPYKEIILFSWFVYTLKDSLTRFLRAKTITLKTKFAYGNLVKVDTKHSSSKFLEKFIFIKSRESIVLTTGKAKICCSLFSKAM